MIQKGSQRARAASAGGLSGLSCPCMKTTPQSGQGGGDTSARNGYTPRLVEIFIIYLLSNLGESEDDPAESIYIL